MNKTGKMKLVTFISSGAFIFFSAFVMKKENSAEQTALYNTRWGLKKIHHAGRVETVTGHAFIRFDGEKKSAGGDGGCNGFGSSITVSGNLLSIRDIISTQRYCEGVQKTEDAFFEQLGKVNRYVIQGKKLLLFKDKEVLLEFKKNN